jgi:uncharacterized protein
MRKDALSVAVTILFAMAVCATAASAGNAGPITSTIRVSGKGSVQAEPDTATIRIGVTTEKPSAQEAVSANTASVTKIVSGLEAGGVEKKDLKTSNFSVYAQYRTEADDKRQIISFRVSNTVVVTIRDTAKAGDILTKAVAAGSNQISGPSFSISDPEKYLNEARKKAVANAMDKARAYATAAGKTLGDIVEISEPGVPASSMGFIGGAPSRALAAAPVPIETGEERLDAQIYLVIELK